MTTKQEVCAPWTVKTISGYAGGRGEASPASVTLKIDTWANAVEDVRQRVEALPDLLEACIDAFLQAHPCPACGQVELLGAGLARCPCADRPWDWRSIAPVKDGWKSCRDAIAKAEGHQ